MTQPREIQDLEHDGNEHVPAVAPIGAEPDHCELCAGTWARRRYAEQGLTLTNREALDRWHDEQETL